MDYFFYGRSNSRRRGEGNLDLLNALIIKKGKSMAMSRLYKQFGEIFSEDLHFWKQMSQQEKAHADWIGEWRE